MTRIEGYERAELLGKVEEKAVRSNAEEALNALLEVKPMFMPGAVDERYVGQLDPPVGTMRATCLRGTPPVC